MIQIKEFFDKNTWTLTYVVWDENTKDAIVIDPVMDYDSAASKISDVSAQAVIEFVRAHELRLHFILETHAHADHLSGSQIIKRAFPEAQIAIGEKITKVQEIFKGVFGLPEEFKTDGSQFDRLIKDGEEFLAGSIKIKTFFTPGHTPACASYYIDGNVFVGDALFMPDYGTGRCDFPAGSATDLYRSVHGRIYELPEDTKVYTGHDYLPNGRALKFMSTIAEEKKENIQLKGTTALEDFVKLRNERDRTLAAPKLLLPSVQVNIDAGNLPPADQNGKRYLRIPIS
ncbi:MBL fold metallo-hydrolase [Bdellovibrio sp. NC01]|uniref:MBL fold metallo-hydrolase n=1 Tax=Bdellovibrio sp. NC01 TaxID=2220073 RepID=UPI00115AEAF9|nr:MBL fold metallo-hydrolase [Bdellovibrio sp. NC01]QDK39354.1 MBL fold metallo-hydrolase [Bdellovibrio sp. NC01]